MANPQQPELRRSEQIPALSPDAMKAKLEAQEDGLLHQGETPASVQDQKTAQATTSDQDKPDLDDFADALGTSSDD